MAAKRITFIFLLGIRSELADLSDELEGRIHAKQTDYISLLQRSASVQKSKEPTYNFDTNAGVLAVDEGASRSQCSVTEPARLKSTLRSSPHVNLTFKGYHDHDYSLQGLFVYPPKKFAFCLIEKNACSTWIGTVFQQLLQENEWSKWLGTELVKHGLMQPNFNVSKQSQAKFGEQGLESVFQDPSATRAVFVREPLERFASAFLNKCINTNLYYCPVGSSVFRDVVEWALATDLTSVDGHFLPQAFHCELHKRISQYNVIGLMKEDTLTDDMNCVLAKAGLHDFIGKAPSHEKPRNVLLNTTVVLQKLFTPAAALRLIDRLHYDYDLFGFPKVPDWVAGATGEWYNKDPTQELAYIQTDSHGRRNDTASVDVDTYDLVELALRAGYIP